MKSNLRYTNILYKKNYFSVFTSSPTLHPNSSATRLANARAANRRG